MIGGRRWSGRTAVAKYWSLQQKKKLYSSSSSSRPPTPTSSRNSLLAHCPRVSVCSWQSSTHDYLTMLHRIHSESSVQRDPSKLQRRSYHSTRKQEILPLLVAATAIGVIGRYSYRAVQRMRDEWEDYEYELQLYEKQMKMKHRSKEDGSHPDSSAYGTVATDEAFRTVAVDLGSTYTKVAWSDPQPQIVVTREGHRQLFNGIQYEGDSSSEIRARGPAALEKYFFPIHDESGASAQSTVTLPWNMLLDAHSSENNRSSTEIVKDSLQPFLTEIVDRMSSAGDDSQPTAPLRLTATLPTEFVQFQQENNYLRSLFSRILNTSEANTVLLPDPVAAVWGAQYEGMIPVGTSKTDAKRSQYSHHKVLVIDVGGIVTQLAIVEKDRVLASCMVPWGGETLVELAVERLRSADDTIKSLTQDERSLSALQIHARTAVHELSSLTQTRVHVPYLFADPKQHHLEATLSRVVLEQMIQNDIRENLVPSLPSSSLSPHMSTPTNLTTFWASLITQLLEDGKSLPHELDHVLIVGGATRFPVIPSSIREVWFLLSGSDPAINSERQRLILPESSLRSDLVALGAATMLPSFQYSLQGGLTKDSY